MALAAAAARRKHGAVMTQPFTSLAGSSSVPDAPAASARTVLVWGDDAYARRHWAAALADEGLSVDISANDDASPTPRSADAWVLHISGGLSANLGRLRALQALHGQGSAPPLLVAARALRELDQVLALEMGADDVVDTGLAASVVAARLRALWRRAWRGTPSEEPSELRFGGLQLLRNERRVLLHGTTVALTEGEFAVLWLLATHAGSTLPRREILRRVRGLDDHPMDRSIDSRIYRIRAKLGDNRAASPRIRTVRNLGYALTQAPW
jgi:two-component system, OmpR family, response regulator